MKSKVKSFGTFRPFKLEFEIETIEEARLFYHICDFKKMKSVLMEERSWQVCAIEGQDAYSEKLADMIDDGRSSRQIKEQILRQGFKV